MTRSEPKPPPGVKRGFIEYLLLTVLLIVVIVTAWTLWDNGIVGTLARLLDGTPP